MGGSTSEASSAPSEVAPAVAVADANGAPGATAAAPGSDVEAAVVEFIHSRINFERLPTDRYDLTDFKLDRVQRLLSRLGDPQMRPAVHIAGTKGKGSSAAMIAAIAQAAGYRVGLFTSPHMHHVGERMTVDGELPTGQELSRLLEVVRPEVEAMDRTGDHGRTTFFEVLTAMAWVHFRNRDVDLVVLETGLGGRLDATNICQPLACLITSISRDHERLLGSTLQQIAAEKAGILKPGVPAFSGVREAEPQGVIQTVARQVGTPLYELGTDIRFHSDAATPAAVSPCVEPRHALVDVVTPWRSHAALRSPLAGAHQAANLSLSVAAVDCLDAAGWQITPAAITQGLAKVQWPLRVEVIGRAPLIIVDAAHNVASIAALGDTLRSVDLRPRILVFGTARDKDTEGMLRQLADLFDQVILTRFINNPRAVARSHLESLAQNLLRIPWTWVDDPAAAWQRATELARADGLICATGSFFLASEFRAVVCGSGARA